MPNIQISRVNILQALRTYASLPIIFFHTGFVVSGIHKIGVFGVHMFFVLSGFIMASILASNPHAFMRRRIIRVLPSYWLMTILCYLVALNFPSLMNATRAAPIELVKSLFFIPFVKSNGLYQPILFIGWTINYEMFFYGVLGVSLALFRRQPLYLASAILLAVFLLSNHFASSGDIAAFYANSAILEFILGLCSYYLVMLVPTEIAIRLRPVLITILLSSLIIMPVIEGLGWLSSHSTFLRYGPLSFLVIVCSCVLAAGGCDMRSGLIVLIGDASYCLYLTHPYIEMFLDRVVAKRFPFFHINTLPGCLVAMAVSIIAALIIYLKIEKPAIRYLNSRFCGTTPGRRAAPVPPVPSSEINNSQTVSYLLGTVAK